MLTAVCYNAGGLLAVRFFLGMAESAIAPGLTMIISMWYKRSEQPMRQGAWFLGNTCAGLFGGLVGYGLGHVDGIAPWKVCTIELLVFGTCAHFNFLGHLLGVWRCHSCIRGRGLHNASRYTPQCPVLKSRGTRHGCCTSREEHDWY